MKTLEIEVSNDLFQRLQPYKDRLAHLLDMSLSMLTKSSNGKEKPVENSMKERSRKPIINLEEYKKTEAYRQRKELLEYLHNEGIATGPDIDTMLEYVTHPDQQNRQLIKVGGKPVSEIIIENRRGAFSE